MLFYFFTWSWMPLFPRESSSEDDCPGHSPPAATCEVTSGWMVTAPNYMHACTYHFPEETLWGTSFPSALNMQQLPLHIILIQHSQERKGKRRGGGGETVTDVGSCSLNRQLSVIMDDTSKAFHNWKIPWFSPLLSVAVSFATCLKKSQWSFLWCKLFFRHSFLWGWISYWKFWIILAILQICLCDT